MSPTLNETEVRLECIYGHIRLEQRQRREGNRLIFEGRAWHYSGDKLVKVTEWSPTGALVDPEPEPRRWWEFWKCA